MADVTAAPSGSCIVDDDPLVRAGLAMMLDGAPTTSRSSARPPTAPRCRPPSTAHAPDVVLMDIRMPGIDGLTATEALRARRDPPEVIVLTTFDADEHVLRALRAGASGFLLKDTPPAEIVDAVRQVAAGDPILSPAVTRRLIARVADSAPTTGARRAARAGLDAAQRPRTRGRRRGRPGPVQRRDRRRRCTMSVPTVKTHVSRILTKLDLNNRVQIALLAHDAGLLDGAE